AFLAVLAGHSKLAAINGYADLRHFPGTLSRCYINLATSFEPFCSIVGSSRSSRRNLTRVFLVAELQDAANCFDRLIDSLRDLAMGPSQRPGAGGCLIQLPGKSCAIAAKRVNVFGERPFGTVGFAPPFGCRLQSFQRQRQALRRGFDRIGVAHRHPRRQSRRTTCEKRATGIIYDEKLTSYRWKTSTPRRLPCA